jgi:hypothetical protein
MAVTFVSDAELVFPSLTISFGCPPWSYTLHGAAFDYFGEPGNWPHISSSFGQVRVERVQCCSPPSPPCFLHNLLHTRCW